MNSVILALKDEKEIVLLPHISPDADAMGSCFAMAAALEKQDIKCRIIMDEPLPSYLDFLDGNWEVYDEDIDYNMKNKLCLCIDCGDLGRVGKRSALFADAKNVVSIDHHSSNTRYANVNWVEADKPATGVLIYKYIKACKIELDNYIALMLYTAICGDTGNFKYSNTTSETFEIASKLLKYDIRHWDISKAIFDTEELDILRLKGYLMQNIKSYLSGRVALVSIDSETIEKFGVKSSDVDALVDIPRKVKGCEIAVSVKESGDAIKVSLRSATDADVSKIAKKFGGGGHIKAAGFVVCEKSIDEVCKMIIDAISEEMK